MAKKIDDDDEVEAEVTVLEAEEELLVFPISEHPLLDGDLIDYQHSPATAGLDYPAPGSDTGVLVDDDAEAAPKKSEKSSGSKRGL